MSLAEKAEQFNGEQEKAVERKALVVRDSSRFATILDTGKFEQIQRTATLFANSKMVPAHFQKDMPSVFVVMQMALRMDVDPFMMLQHTYVVHGRPGIEGKMIIALINSRGPFTGPVQWKFLDDNGREDPSWFEGATKCRAFATHEKTREICSATVRREVVEAEGWDKPKGNMTSKWVTMPELMYQYRSATWLARLYCPEVLMGLSTLDELEDIKGEIIDAQYVEHTEPDPNADVPKHLGETKKIEVQDNTEPEKEPEPQDNPDSEPPVTANDLISAAASNNVPKAKFDEILKAFEIRLQDGRSQKNQERMLGAFNKLMEYGIEENATDPQDDQRVLADD